MSKSLKMKSLRERFRTGALALTMSLSLAAFGCTTNQTLTSGEPHMARPAGGSVTPSLSTTPGSAAMSTPTMVSGGVDASVDAEAVLEANRGFEGRVLGPADPGNGPSMNPQFATGQYLPPAALVNPIATINSSVNSDGVGQTTAVVSGAGEGIGGGAAGVVATGVVTGGTTAAATTGGIGLANVGNAGTTAASNANFGATGVSNTTATGVTNSTTVATNISGGTNLAVSTGAAAAPSTASSVLATRTLGTSPRLNNDLTAAARGAATTGGALTVNQNGLATTGVTTGNGSAVRVTQVGGRVVVTNQNATASTTGRTSGNNQ